MIGYYALSAMIRLVGVTDCGDPDDFRPNYLGNDLGHAKPIYPYEYPALIPMIVAFVGIWFFSVTDNSEEGKQERLRFKAQFVRSQTGLGASQSSSH